MNLKGALLVQGWIYVQKNLKLSILEFGVFWNCLSWSTRKSSKLSIETWSQHFSSNVEEYHWLALRLQYKGDSGEPKQQNKWKFCTWCGKYFSFSQNCLLYIFFDLKCGGTSAHIFCICLVQNCLSQVKISETVCKSVWVLKLSVLKRTGKHTFIHPCLVKS